MEVICKRKKTFLELFLAFCCLCEVWVWLEEEKCKTQFEQDPGSRILHWISSNLLWLPDYRYSFKTKSQENFSAVNLSLKWFSVVWQMFLEDVVNICWGCRGFQFSSAAASHVLQVQNLDMKYREFFFGKVFVKNDFGQPSIILARKQLFWRFISLNCCLLWET